LARKERADRLRDGRVLYALHRRDARRKPIHFSSFDVSTEVSLISNREWDQIYFCLPSDALRGSLLGEVSRLSGYATVVKIQPGLGDIQIFTRHFERSRIISGMISFVSYAAPLPGEDLKEPGTAYWFPPLLKVLFSGSTDRLQDVVHALQKGGFPARVHDDVETMLGFALAVQAPLTAGIECSGWSIEQFRDGEWLEISCGAIREATAIAADYLDSNPPWLVRVLNPSLVRIVLSFLRRRNPFDVEAYLERHYTKLRQQSLQHLEEYVDRGTRAGLPVESLEMLQQGLERS
jgi:2-dehydropantoate 2-reductase